METTQQKFTYMYLSRSECFRLILQTGRRLQKDLCLNKLLIINVNVARGLRSIRTNHRLITTGYAASFLVCRIQWRYFPSLWRNIFFLDYIVRYSHQFWAFFFVICLFLHDVIAFLCILLLLLNAVNHLLIFKTLSTGNLSKSFNISCPMITIRHTCINDILLLCSVTTA